MAPRALLAPVYPLGSVGSAPWRGGPASRRPAKERSRLSVGTIGGVELLEAIRTTRAMRRLDPSREVSDADLETLLFAATKAPSARNEQPVRWVVVRDRTLRLRLGEIYTQVSRSQAPMAPPDASGDRGLDRADPATAKLTRSVDHLVHHLADAPVLIVACAYGADDVRTAAGVYPAVQNLMLAARSIGLGTTLTSRHRLAMAETRAVLGIPDDASVYAVIPVGYPLGRWGEAPRRPVREVAYRDRWGTPFVADVGS